MSFCSRGPGESQRSSAQPQTECLRSRGERRAARRSPERRLSQRRVGRLPGDHPAEQRREAGTDSERAGGRAHPGVRGRRALPDEDGPHEVPARRRYAENTPQNADGTGIMLFHFNGSFRPKQAKMFSNQSNLIYVAPVIQIRMHFK